MNTYFDHLIQTFQPEPKTPQGGYVVWEGKSPATNTDIVAILTMDSANQKTGNMAQLWILNKNVSPQDAVNSGEDQSVCGMCPNRHYSGGGCYVLPWREPSQVWKAYKSGKYQKFNNQTFVDKGVRLGAYGDPSMLPYEVVNELSESFAFHTGYTNQWYAPWYDNRFNDLLQLSVNERSITKAYKLHPKAKVFLTVPVGTKYKGSLPECPSKHGITCAQCKTCDGSQTHVYIEAHGSRKSRVD